MSLSYFAAIRDEASCAVIGDTSSLLEGAETPLPRVPMDAISHIVRTLLRRPTSLAANHIPLPLRHGAPSSGGTSGSWSAPSLQTSPIPGRRSVAFIVNQGNSSHLGFIQTVYLPFPASRSAFPVPASPSFASHTVHIVLPFISHFHSASPVPASITYHSLHGQSRLSYLPSHDPIGPTRYLAT